VVAFDTGVGNGNLTPETAITKTTGFVYSPSFVNGLTVAVDYFDIGSLRTLRRPRRHASPSISPSARTVRPRYILPACMGRPPTLTGTAPASLRTRSVARPSRHFLPERQLPYGKSIGASNFLSNYTFLQHTHISTLVH
jgi:hypothetical protein